MKKKIRIVVILIAAAVFLFYAYKLISYLAFGEMNRQENEELVLEAVTVNPDFWETDESDGPKTVPDAALPAPNVTESDTLDVGGNASVPDNAGESGKTDKAGGKQCEIRKPETPISVDFNVLRRKNEDVIAWLYQADTQINYPILQSDDNAYYLRRSFDRKYNVYGCLYLDHRCAADYSDNLSVIYGHEAKNGSMFGSLAGYKKQEYYDTHKVMYLLTPEGNYRVRVFAGIIARTNSRYFAIPATDEKLAERIHEAIENSTFKSDVREEEIGRVLMLTTCTYEFANARYLVFGTLEPIEGE